MEQIPDDPIIACIMRTGYPPWMQEGRSGEDTEPFAVYDPSD